MDKSDDIGKTSIAIQTESAPIRKSIETDVANKDVNLFLQNPSDEIHDTHRNETTEISHTNLPTTQTEESSQPNEADNSIRTNKSGKTIADLIFFPFYPIRVKVISAGYTIKHSTAIVNTLKIVTVTLTVSIVTIAIILFIKLLILVAVAIILAYIFWPTRSANSNDNITIQDKNSNLAVNKNDIMVVNEEPTSTANNEEDQQEEYNIVITPPKHNKESFEREVEKNTPKKTEIEKIVEVTLKKADIMETIVEKTIADQEETLEIRKKNRKNKAKKEIATNTENDNPVTKKDIEDVAEFLVEEEHKQEKFNKIYKESIEDQEKQLKERIKKRKEKKTENDAVETAHSKPEEEYTIVVHPPKEVEEEIEIGTEEAEEAEEAENLPDDINPEVVPEIENKPTIITENLEVVDTELQNVIEEVENISKLNTTLATYINESIREKATEVIKAKFSKIDLSSVDIEKNIKSTQVKSPQQAYQHMMYNLNRIINNANSHINRSGTKKSARVVSPTDLLITNRFNNGKLDYFDLDFSDIAREAATKVVYFFDHHKTIESLATKFEHDPLLNKVLEKLQYGIFQRSTPTNGTFLVKKQENGLEIKVKTTKKQDEEVTNKVLTTLSRLTGNQKYLKNGAKKKSTSVPKVKIPVAKSFLKKGNFGKIIKTETTESKPTTIRPIKGKSASSRDTNLQRKTVKV